MKYLIIVFIIFLLSNGYALPESTEILALPDSAAIHCGMYDTEDPCEIGHPDNGITQYLIAVRNEGLVNATNVVLENRIPAQMEFVSAEGPVPFQEADGVVKFQSVPVLKPSTVATFKVTCKAVKQGFAKNTAVIKCDQLTESIIQEELTTIVPAGSGIRQVKIPSLHWGIYDTEDPCYKSVETLTKTIPGATVYVVEIRNEGSAAWNNLQLLDKIPKQMKFIAAKAPVSFKVENENIVFEAIPSLKPGECITFRIECQAISSGCAKNTAILKSDQFQDSLIREESTILREFEPFHENGIVKIELWAIDKAGRVLEKLPLESTFPIGGSALFSLPYSLDSHENIDLKVKTQELLEHKIEIAVEYYDKVSAGSAQTKVEPIFTQKKVVPEWEPVMMPLESQQSMSARCYLRVIPDLRAKEAPKRNLSLHCEKFYFLDMEDRKILATGGASGEIIGINIPNKGFWEISLQKFPEAVQEAILCGNEISLFSRGISPYDSEQRKSPLYKIIASHPILDGRQYWIWVSSKPPIQDAGVSIYARSASSSKPTGKDAK